MGLVELSCRYERAVPPSYIEPKDSLGGRYEAKPNWMAR